MPDRPADALARELRERWPDLPLLIASGYSEADMRQKFEFTDRIGFVAKPYDAQALCRALASFGINGSQRT